MYTDWTLIDFWCTGEQLTHSSDFATFCSGEILPNVFIEGHSDYLLQWDTILPFLSQYITTHHPSLVGLVIVRQTIIPIYSIIRNEFDFGKAWKRRPRDKLPIESQGPYIKTETEKIKEYLWYEGYRSGNHRKLEGVKFKIEIRPQK